MKKLHISLLLVAFIATLAGIILMGSDTEARQAIESELAKQQLNSVDRADPLVLEEDWPALTDN